jgi:hypothetical protein
MSVLAQTTGVPNAIRAVHVGFARRGAGVLRTLDPMMSMTMTERSYG